MQQYTDKVSALQSKFWDDVDDVAGKFRREVMIPLCRGLNIEFVQGMGDFFFTTRKRNPHDILNTAEGAEDAGFDLHDVFEVLNTQIEYNVTFGDRVEDVRRKHYTK